MANRFAQFVQQPTADDPAAPPPSTNRFSQFVTKSQPAPGGVSVPLYVPAADGGEIRIDDSNRAALEAQQKATEEAKTKEQVAFDATRSPATRVRDAATFAASVPVRAVTQGDFGIGDAFGLVSKQAGQNAAQSERDFARANQSGLETAAAAGDVLMGVPMLSSMGAVPGEMLRTTTAAARQLPSDANRLLRDTSGAARVPGTLPPPTAAAPAATQGASAVTRLPTKEEVIAAGERQGITIPKMVAGSNTQQDVAAALAGIPYAGAPVKMAFDKGLQELGAARNTAMDTLGAPGNERAGQGAKDSVLNWVRKQSKDDLSGQYGEVYKKVDPAITRDLGATRQIATKIQQEMQDSASTADAPALKMVEDALSRPEGLSAQGLAKLRSVIGDKIDAAKITPDASEAAYKRLYPALTNDLRATVQKAGGDEALTAWDTANREAKIVSAKRKRLAKIVGARDDDLSAEKVLERINDLAAIKGGNQRSLTLLKDTVGPNDWGNVGAEFVSRLGANPKNGLFSGDRYLTAYGKMSEAGKDAIFGAAKPALDDIALIAKRFEDLGNRFNKSNTGKVTAMLKLLSNPVAVFGNLATAAINPLSVFTIGGQLGGMGIGRKMAWNLARPATAKKASGLLRAYYGVENAAARGAGIVAAREQKLASATRLYAQEIARQTGGNVDDISASLTAEIHRIRNQQK